MSATATELAELFHRDLERLLQELRAFPDTASLWQTAPGVSNAAGTLALHLEGNLREYIGRQLGHIEYTRDRPLEFTARGVAQAELIARIEAVQASIPRVIAVMSDARLAEDFPEVMYGRRMSARLMLMHLATHLNYHLGQVDYLRRFVTGRAAIDLASL